MQERDPNVPKVEKITDPRMLPEKVYHKRINQQPVKKQQAFIDSFCILEELIQKIAIGEINSNTIKAKEIEKQIANARVYGSRRRAAPDNKKKSKMEVEKEK